MANNTFNNIADEHLFKSDHVRSLSSTLNLIVEQNEQQEQEETSLAQPSTKEEKRGIKAEQIYLDQLNEEKNVTHEQLSRHI